MTTDPESMKKPKTEDKCPYCQEPTGKDHKRSCGLWSPYSTSKWVKAADKPEPSQISWRIAKQYTINNDPMPMRIADWPWPFPPFK